MGKPKVLLTVSIPEAAVDRLKKEFEVRVITPEIPYTKDVLIKEVADIDAVIADGMMPFDAEVMDAAPKLKIITRFGVGYDNVEVKSATARKIYATYTPGVLSDSVAELTIGLILCLSRRICKANEYVKNGSWTRQLYSFPLGNDLCEKTLGIIGLGRIGLEVARRANAFKMTILYYDVVRKIEAEKLYNAKYSDLKSLLKKSDFITIHVASTPQTEKMIGRAELRQMKRTAYLINMARGKVIDQAALYEALEEERLAGAALDVLEVEPIAHGDPMLGLENVILTPHIGSATIETRVKMGLTAAEDVIRVLKGEKPIHLINRELLKSEKRS